MVYLELLQRGLAVTTFDETIPDVPCGTGDHDPLSGVVVEYTYVDEVYQA